MGRIKSPKNMTPKEIFSKQRSPRPSNSVAMISNKPLKQRKSRKSKV